jgi:S1-C subfamily serine protease
VDTSDFDESEPAPLPAYDRQWRHPAEHAADDRTHHLSTAPPLSRRLSAVSAVISVIASIAVLVIAIPKGVADYTVDAADELTSTTVPVKGAFGTAMAAASSAKGPTSAVSLGNGYWLVALDGIEPTDNIWLTTASGEDVPAVLMTQDERAGIAVIKCDHPDAEGPILDTDQLIDSSSLKDLSPYRVVDSFTEQVYTPERSFKSVSIETDTPLNMPEVIRGVATMTDRRGQLVGIVVRRGYSAWMLSKDSLENILQSVVAK